MKFTIFLFFLCLKIFLSYKIKFSSFLKQDQNNLYNLAVEVVRISRNNPQDITNLTNNKVNQINQNKTSDTTNLTNNKSDQINNKTNQTNQNKTSDTTNLTNNKSDQINNPTNQSQISCTCINKLTNKTIQISDKDIKVNLTDIKKSVNNNPTNLTNNESHHTSNGKSNNNSSLLNKSLEKTNTISVNFTNLIINISNFNSIFFDNYLDESLTEYSNNSTISLTLFRQCISKNLTVDTNNSNCSAIGKIFESYYLHKLFIDEDKFDVFAFDNLTNKTTLVFSTIFAIKYLNLTTYICNLPKFLELIYYINILHNRSNIFGNTLKIADKLSKFLIFTDYMIKGEKTIRNKNILSFLLNLEKSYSNRFNMIFAILSLDILNNGIKNHEQCESNVNYREKETISKYLCLKYESCKFNLSRDLKNVSISNALIESRESFLMQHLLNKYSFFKNQTIYNLSEIENECYIDITKPYKSDNFLHYIIISNSYFFKQNIINYKKIRKFINANDLKQITENQFLLLAFFNLDFSNFLSKNYETFYKFLLKYACESFKIINYKSLSTKFVLIHEIKLLSLFIDKLMVLFDDNMSFLRHFDKITYNTLSLKKKFKNNILNFISDLTRELNDMRKNTHMNKNYFLKSLRQCIENIKYFKKRISWSNDYSRFNLNNFMIKSMVKIYNKLYLNDKKN